MSAPLCLNFDRVINDPSLMAVVRFALLRIKNRKASYTSPGEFLRDLSDGDLRSLLELTEYIESKKDDPEEKRPIDKAIENIMLLSVGLAVAEGSLDMTEDTMYKVVDKTVDFIALESLCRKGIIDLDREKLSYVDDHECARLKTS